MAIKTVQDIATAIYHGNLAADDAVDLIKELRLNRDVSSNLPPDPDNLMFDDVSDSDEPEPNDVAYFDVLRSANKINLNQFDDLVSALNHNNAADDV